MAQGLMHATALVRQAVSGVQKPFPTSPAKGGSKDRPSLGKHGV